MEHDEHHTHHPESHDHHPDHIHLPHVPEKDIRIVFIISLILKAIGAAGQIVLGFILLFTTGVTQTIVTLAQNELIEDPNDFFATHITNLAAHVPVGTQLFGAIYLLAHGIIKAFLVWGLIKNRLWAYPASIAVFSLFIVYQVVRWFNTHSVFLIILTVFDVFVLWLIWHEYRYLLKKRHIMENI